MGPLALIIPGLLWVFEHIVGPLTEESKSSIGSSLMGLVGSTFSSGIMGIFSQYMNNASSKQQQDFQLAVDSLLGQIQIDEVEAKSENIFVSGWRPAIAWILGLNIGLHYTLVNMIDILNSLFHFSICAIPPMDNMALALMSGILGLYMVARTV